MYTRHGPADTSIEHPCWCVQGYPEYCAALRLKAWLAGGPQRKLHTKGDADGCAVCVIVDGEAAYTGRARSEADATHAAVNSAQKAGL